MQWTKFGCGHLVALPMLYVSGVCAYILIRSPNVTRGDLGFLGTIMLITGAIGGGLLVYLWRVVWRGDEGEEGEESTPAAVEKEALAEQDASGAPSVALGAKDESAERQADATENVDDVDRADSEEVATEEVPTEEAEPTPRLGPDERPWDVRKAWRNPRISTSQGSGGQESGKLGVFAGLLFVGLAVWIGIDAPAKWPMAAACGAVGVLVLALVGYRAHRRQRFGDTTFEMDTMPGVLGGPLCGVLHTGIQEKDAPDHGVHVQLSCYHRHITYDNEDNETVSRTLLWRDEKNMTPFPASAGETLDVPVVFDIPDGLPPSTPKKTANRHMWTVEASAAVPGVDYRSVLEIPVFPVVADGSAPVEAYRQHERTTSAMVSPDITVERHSPGQMEVTFGRARRPGVALFMTMLCAGIVALTGTAFAGGALFWAGLLGLAGALSAWGALYYWTHRSTIAIENGAIRVRSGMIGFESEIIIPCDALDAALLVASGSDAYTLHLDCNRPVKGEAERRTVMRKIVRWMSGDQPSTGESWDAYMKRYGLTDDRVVAASMITNHLEAKGIASQIEEAAADCARFT